LGKVLFYIYTSVGPSQYLPGGPSVMAIGPNVVAGQYGTYEYRLAAPGAILYTPQSWNANVVALSWYDYYKTYYANFSPAKALCGC
jgi:hypothetical protein